MWRIYNLARHRTAHGISELSFPLGYARPPCPLDGLSALARAGNLGFKEIDPCSCQETEESHTYRRGAAHS